MTLGEHPREKMNQEYLYGQKDWNIHIENDTKEWIGHDWHLVVMHDQLERVEGDKHEYVKGDHNIKIDGTLSIEVGADLQQKTAQHYAHKESGWKVANKKTGALVNSKERGRYKSVYVSTAAYGQTIFWKYDPDFIKATGAKEYR